jgi:hypothetical protein
MRILMSSHGQRWRFTPIEWMFASDIFDGMGCLKGPPRNALGFRNFTHYRWRSLLHSGALHSLVNAL